MLRITRHDVLETDSILLRIEGDVRGQWVDELRRACDEATLPSSGDAVPRLVLDLGEVLFIDANGIALFQELSSLRVRLTNCSLFIAEQLKEVANGCR
jgi:anti-anti-sigma regulatory factor